MNNNTIINRPEFSVIVPAYNAAPFLDDCIDSIQRQSLADFELVIVDDGSTDNTADICACRAETDKRIRFVSQKNGGVVEARKTGIAMANGQWLTFVDADDTILSDMLQTLHTYIHTYIHTQLIVMHAGDNRVCTNMEYAESLYSFKRVQICAKAFCADVVKQTAFDIPRYLRVGEDFLMNLAILPHIIGNVLMTTDEKYNYRLCQTSAMSTFQPDYQYEKCMLEQVDRIFDSYPQEYKQQVFPFFVNFKVGHLAAMMARGYKINPTDECIARIKEDAGKVALPNHLAGVIQAIDNPLLRIPMRVKKMLRSTARKLIDAINGIKSDRQRDFK